MNAPPLPENESDRLAALLQCSVLDTAPEPGFDDLAQLAAHLCNSQIALVSLLDDRRQWFKSRIGLDVTETPREHAFCAYAIMSDEPLVIEDATQDNRTCDNPLVTGAPHIRFYAGVPLTLGTGESVGTLCVIDKKPRTISAEQLRTLRALARQVVTQLELRRHAVQLQEAMAAAEQANQAKSHFLANMSHEIRTPLTAILGFADLLTEQGLSEASRDSHLATIQRNGAHLLSLINDVLDMAKIESGHVTADIRPTDLARLIDDEIELMRLRANEKRLTLQVTCRTPVPRRVMTDPLRFRQVLNNLIGNAVKFTENGSIDVQLRFDQSSTQLAIDIVDTGIGIHDDELSRIFQVFTQANNSTTRQFGGTGIGLCVSRQLAQLLGGDITVASTPGCGSCFTFSLRAKPIDPADRLAAGAWSSAACDDAARSSVAALPASSEHPLAGARVLFVEDGPDNQRLISIFLERAGAEVVVFENGRAALDHLTGDHESGNGLVEPVAYDFVLTDMQMPEMDGYTLATRLRAEGWRQPIIAITAHAMTHEEERCIAAGCDAYIAKPIKAAALIDLCLHWYDRARTSATA